MTYKAIEYITPFVKHGVTTLELDGLIKDWLRKNSCISACYGYKGGCLPFPAYSCISVNDVICHGIPAEYLLRDGDLVKVDICLSKNGYYGDICRTIACGNLSKKRQRLLDFSEKITREACYLCRPGLPFKELAVLISTAAIAAGYNVCRNYMGHGTGIKLHEPPVIPYDETCNIQGIMQPGMIFTVEPMICAGTYLCTIDADGWTARTADRRDSAQFEETVLITNTGHEILTKSPKEI